MESADSARQVAKLVKTQHLASNVQASLFRLAMAAFQKPAV